MFQGRHKFNINNGNGKGHVKIFPGRQAMLPRKIFSEIASQVVSFSQKKWCSAIDTKFGTFLARILLISKPIPNFSGMSLTLLIIVRHIYVDGRNWYVDFLWGRVWLGLRLRIRLRFTIWLSFPVRISFWYRYSGKSSVLSSQKNRKDQVALKKISLKEQF